MIGLVTCPRYPRLTDDDRPSASWARSALPPRRRSGAIPTSGGATSTRWSCARAGTITGDFRVQIEHGGSAVPVRAPDAIVAAGADIVAKIPGRLLFVRIDGVLTPRGFMLMEAECIEPQLFFEQAPGARANFARALFGKLTAET